MTEPKLAAMSLEYADELHQQLAARDRTISDLRCTISEQKNRLETCRYREIEARKLIERLMEALQPYPYLCKKCTEFSPCSWCSKADALLSECRERGYLPQKDGDAQ